MEHNSQDIGLLVIEFLDLRVFNVVDELIFKDSYIAPALLYIRLPFLCCFCGCSHCVTVFFGGTMGYILGLVGYYHAVLERLVYSFSFMVRPVLLWWPPPCIIGGFSVMEYRSCVIYLMALYLGSP